MPQRLRSATRLATLLGGALGLVALGPIAPASAASTLGQLAAAHGRYFGSAVDNSQLTSDAPYASILGSEFNQVTPENGMKWDTVEPQQGVFNFSRGDQIVTFARQHGQRIRGHNLVWHSQLPGWVSSLPTSQVRAAMENHITQEVTHYAGDVFAWDVVNEPFNEDGTLRQDAFTNAMGSGYIADALRTARAADPNAKLYLNDFNIEGLGAKSDAMFNLVSSLKAQGVPIDGVGFETHLAIQFPFPTQMQQNLQRFADLGVDVAITEADVRMQLPRSQAKDATQSQYYTQITNACLAVTRCVGITTWEYTDKYSWVPGTFSGEGAADLYDENLQTKPAYAAVQGALGGGVADSTPPTAPSNLRVTGTTATSVSLSWSAATDNVGVTAYEVSDGGTPVATVTGTSATVGGLSPSTTHTFTVRARDAAGNTSPASASVTATTAEGPPPPQGNVVGQYRNYDTAAPRDNQIKPGLRIVNNGATPLNLSTVTIRYYFTAGSGAASYATFCDFATVGCANVTQQVVAMATPASGADHYLQVGFTSGAGSIAPGASSGDAQLRFNKTDFSAFDETDDYSWSGTQTGYGDATKITVFVNGALVSGIEP